MSTFNTFVLKLSRSNDSAKNNGSIKGPTWYSNETYLTRKHWRNLEDASKLGIHLDGSSDSLAPDVLKSGAKQRNPTGPEGTAKSINK